MNNYKDMNRNLPRSFSTRVISLFTCFQFDARTSR